MAGCLARASSDYVTDIACSHWMILIYFRSPPPPRPSGGGVAGPRLSGEWAAVRPIRSAGSARLAEPLLWLWHLSLTYVRWDVLTQSDKPAVTMGSASVSSAVTSPVQSPAWGPPTSDPAAPRVRVGAAVSLPVCEVWGLFRRHPFASRAVVGSKCLPRRWQTGPRERVILRPAPAAQITAIVASCRSSGRSAGRGRRMRLSLKIEGCN